MATIGMYDTPPPNLQLATSGIEPRIKKTRVDECQWRRKKKKREHFLAHQHRCHSDCTCINMSPQLSNVYSDNQLSPSDTPNVLSCSTISSSPQSKGIDSMQMTFELSDSLWIFLNSSRRDQNFEHSRSRMWRIVSGTWHFYQELSGLLTLLGIRKCTKRRTLPGISSLNILFCAFVIVSSIMNPSAATTTTTNGGYSYPPSTPASSALDAISNSTATILDQSNNTSKVRDTSMHSFTNTPSSGSPTDLQDLTPANNYTWVTADSSNNYTWVAANSSLNNITISTNKSEILLGYITTMNHPQNPELAAGRKISGAMTLAVNVVNDDPTILPNHHLRYLLGNNNGTELNSLRVLTEQWQKGTLAFFGPEDSCEIESRIAAAWGIPILAYVSLPLKLL
ncbi:guanylate cyclase [Elysia marginata]|uniref:Guanylate cyclase n=1 Tax=Elysia marginata TaxID=1093978 RepID=A0AAV4GWQ3_9GAST|nr:guanylate cyclase [Elysia marginata]